MCQNGIQMKLKPIKNMKLDSSIAQVEVSFSNLEKELKETSQNAYSNSTELYDIEVRVQALAKQLGVSVETFTYEETYEIAEPKVSDKPQKNYRLDRLSGIDTVLTCVAGGIAVLVDFLVVRIPKNSKIVRGGQTIEQTGSPMTEVLGNIGFTSDGNTSKWVKTLEKVFKVNYDTSTIKGEKGFCPSSHRIYSLAHDPSPSGLLWALKDAICGTMSYIDKDGILKSIPTTKLSPWRILATPIIWIGHIISDLFTKRGIPIPGTCLLRTLQFGSFGDKQRTISEVVSYMYYEGYDLRHFATMSITNACIELILRIYHALTKERVERFMQSTAVVEAQQSMIRHRLEKMRLGAYSVACCGNIAKLAVYQWNPNALNLPVWMEFLRTAICEYERTHSAEQDAINAVVLRLEIEDNFKRMEEKLELL